MSDLEALEQRVRPAAGEPAGALVLMHGRGVDERDLWPLLDDLDPEKRLVAVAPRGPLQLPPGGFHWYGVRQVGFPDRETFWTTYEVLDRWLAALAQETGVPPERTVLGGFSQGAVMAYAMGLGAGRPVPAGILALSGFIPTVDGWECEADGRVDLPVAIAHGTHDPIIGVEWGQEARDRLTAAGLDVTYRESPIPHSVDPGVIDEFAGWLERAVP